MQVILTQEEYDALKKPRDLEPILRDYRNRLEKKMFPFLNDVIRAAAECDLRYRHALAGDSLMRSIATQWSELFKSVPINPNENCDTSDK